MSEKESIEDILKRYLGDLYYRPDHRWAEAWLNVGLKIGEQMDEAADAERENPNTQLRVTRYAVKRKRSVA